MLDPHAVAVAGLDWGVAAQPKQEPLDLRKHERSPANQSARMIWRDEITQSCRVVNLSEGGACLVVQDPTRIPLSFVLEIEGSESRPECVVCWQSHKRVGVRFVRA
jgi:hypothetical protein